MTASDDGTARIWSIDGSECAAIDPGAGRVWSAAFAADGRAVYTTSREIGLQRWPLDLAALADLAARRSQPDSRADAERWRAMLHRVLGRR